MPLRTAEKNPFDNEYFVANPVYLVPVARQQNWFDGVNTELNVPERR